MRNECNTKEKRKVLEHLPQILRDHPEREREREWREADIASVCIENEVWETEPEFSCSKSGFFLNPFLSSMNKSLVFFQSKIKLENSVECRDKDIKKKRENRLNLMGNHNLPRSKQRSEGNAVLKRFEPHVFSSYIVIWYSGMSLQIFYLQLTSSRNWVSWIIKRLDE